MSEFSRKSESYNIRGVNSSSGGRGCALYLFLFGLAALAVIGVLVYQLLDIPKNMGKSIKDALRVETTVTEKISTEFSKLTGRQDFLLCSENETISDFKTIERKVAGITSKGHFAVRVPVEYNYFVPLNDRKNWRFECSGETLQVTVPPIKFLEPNVKWLEAEQFIYGGMLISSEKELNDMKEHMSRVARRNASRKVDAEIIKQAARMSLAKFFNEWIPGKTRQELKLRSIVFKFQGEADFPPVKFALSAAPPPQVTLPPNNTATKNSAVEE
jgi:hypothetical protein